VSSPFAPYITKGEIQYAKIACLSAELNSKKACCEDSLTQFCGLRLLTTPLPGWKRLFEKDLRTLTLSWGICANRSSRSRPRLHACVQAIADGQPSQSIMAAIGECERALRGITDKLREPRPGSLRSTLDELRTFAVSRLTNIRNLIAHPESVDQARTALAEHFGAFTLEPVSRDGKATYLVHGKLDFFGDGANGWCRGREVDRTSAC